MSLGGRKGFAVVFTVIGILSIFIFASMFGGLGNSAANSGNLHTYTPSHGGLYGIQTSYQQAFGWDGHQWVKGTLAKATADSNSVTGVSISFTDYGNISVVYLFTNNNTQDVAGLLQQSLIFNYANITTSSTSGKTNLSAAYLLLGSEHNSSATNNINDKRVTNAIVNQTIYSSSTNNVAKSAEMSTVGMFSNLNGKAMYAFYLNNSKTNKTSTLTITLYQQFEYPFAFNLEEVVYGAAAVLALLAVVPLYFAVPRRYGA